MEKIIKSIKSHPVLTFFGITLINAILAFLVVYCLVHKPISFDIALKIITNKTFLLLFFLFFVSEFWLYAILSLLIGMFKEDTKLAFFFIIFSIFLLLIMYDSHITITISKFLQIFIYLTAISALLLSFTLTGFFTINEKYKNLNKSVYTDEKLAKEIVEIYRFLIIFILGNIIEIFAIPFFPDTSFHKLIFDKQYINYNLPGQILMAITFIAILFFAYAFYKVYQIISNFYFYDSNKKTD